MSTLLSLLSVSPPPVGSWPSAPSQQPSPRAASLAAAVACGGRAGREEESATAVSRVELSSPLWGGRGKGERRLGAGASDRRRGRGDSGGGGEASVRVHIRTVRAPRACSKCSWVAVEAARRHVARASLYSSTSAGWTQRGREGMDGIGPVGVGGLEERGVGSTATPSARQMMAFSRRKKKPLVWSVSVDCWAHWSPGVNQLCTCH